MKEERLFDRRYGHKRTPKIALLRTTSNTPVLVLIILGMKAPKRLLSFHALNSLHKNFSKLTSSIGILTRNQFTVLHDI